MTELDINDAIREVLILMRSELHEHNVLSKPNYPTGWPLSWVTGSSCNR